jgi:hypothetical protein
MAKEVAQELVVTMTAGTALYVELTPAVDKTTAQQLGMARVGDTQTVTIEPAS